MRLRYRCRPRGTALEGRAVPAVFVIADGDIAALAAAITASNTNNQPDTIQLAAGGTYTFNAVGDSADGGNALPKVLRDRADANTLRIEGNGATFRRSAEAGTPQFRFLRLGDASGSVIRGPVFVTVTDLHFANGAPAASDNGSIVGGAIAHYGGDLSVQGCTFAGNQAGLGGAVYVAGSSYSPWLFASDSTFTANGAGLGGAIYCSGSRLDLQRCQFTGNSAASVGGAVSLGYPSSSCVTTVSATEFVANSSNASGINGGGGAMYLSGSTAIADSTVRDNVSAGAGGGLLALGGSLTLTNSTVSRNRANAVSGGGIYTNGNLTLVNSTVHDNSAPIGGGIMVGQFSVTVSITHSTVTDNRAFSTSISQRGGGISSSSQVSLGHSVVAGNRLEVGTLGYGPDIAASVNSLGYNLIQSTQGATITGTATGNVAGVPANLGPLQDNGGPTFTRLPLAGSPALNAGDPAFAPPPAADQRGLPRVALGRIDIGAAEAQIVPAPRVAGVAVNAGQANAAQRSRVTSITVAFDTVVTFAGPVADAFGLSRVGGAAVGGFTANAATVNGVTVVTLSGFTGPGTEFGSLADGRYSVLVQASQVSAGGAPLDGDGNGQGGDDFTLNGSVANGLFRLFGDVNGDGTVNAFDYGQFRPAFGSSTGQAAYLDFLDVDGDGVINAFDFAQLRTRFGSGVP